MGDVIAQLKMAMLAATLATGAGGDRSSGADPSLTEAAASQHAAVADYSIAYPAPAAADIHAPVSADDSGYWSYIATTEGAAYSLRIDQFPASIRAPSPTPSVYELLLRGYAAQSGMSLQSFQPAELGGRSGIEGVFVDAVGDTEIRQVLMVGRRVFQVSFRYARGVDATGAGRAFLGSFKIAAG